MQTINKKGRRVRITVLDVFSGGEKGKSKHLTIYNTTADKIYALIEAIPGQVASKNRSTKP